MAKKIKSDGGSSSYYDLPISEDLAKTICGRHIDGQPFIKTEELIEELFDNDYDAGCLFKGFVRAWAETKGGGKEGNDLRYELNKIRYYTDKIEEKHGKQDD